MSQDGNGTGPVTLIITRNPPNLECGFLAGLIYTLDDVRDHFGIDLANFGWQFVPTSQGAGPQQPGVVWFNVGGWRPGRHDIIDQHGHPKNKGDNQVCSLDLINERIQFSTRYPWLSELYRTIRNNELRGTRICQAKHHLRSAMDGITSLYGDEPQLVMNFLIMAMSSIIQECQRQDGKLKIEALFEPDRLKDLVEQTYPGDQCQPYNGAWFADMLDAAISHIKQQEGFARSAIQNAQRQGWTREISWPLAKSRKLKVISVVSQSNRVAQIARQMGFDVIIQWNKGHCQIQTRHILTFGEGRVVTSKTTIHLGALVEALRRLEAKKHGKKIADGQDLRATGWCYYYDDTEIVWYFVEYLSATFNGSLSSMDVEPTLLSATMVLNVVCDFLPLCDGISVDPKDDKRRRLIKAPVPQKAAIG